MHLPPAASWDVHSQRWQGRVLLALGLLGALVLLDFAWEQQGQASTALLGLLLALCVALGLRSVRHAARGRLLWDGGHWHWLDGQDRPVAGLHCVLDLQRLLLLRIDWEQGAPLWLWLESPAMDARWRALRRAVVSSREAQHAQASGALPP